MVCLCSHIQHSHKYANWHIRKSLVYILTVTAIFTNAKILNQSKTKYNYVLCTSTIVIYMYYSKYVVNKLLYTLLNTCIEFINGAFNCQENMDKISVKLLAENAITQTCCTRWSILNWEPAIYTSLHVTTWITCLFINTKEWLSEPGENATESQ